MKALVKEISPTPFSHHSSVRQSITYPIPGTRYWSSHSTLWAKRYEWISERMIEWINSALWSSQLFYTLKHIFQKKVKWNRPEKNRCTSVINLTFTPAHILEPGNSFIDISEELVTYKNQISDLTKDFHFSSVNFMVAINIQPQKIPLGPKITTNLDFLSWRLLLLSLLVSKLHTRNSHKLICRVLLGRGNIFILTRKLKNPRVGIFRYQGIFRYALYHRNR